MNNEKIARELMKLARELTSAESLTIALPEGGGFGKLLRLDKSFIGSSDYMGLAYFWNTAYKHSLRGATPIQRKRVHDMLLKANLDLNGESPQHEQIITRAGLRL